MFVHNWIKIFDSETVRSETKHQIVEDISLNRKKSSVTKVIDSNDESCDDILHHTRQHRPSLLRQTVFEIILFIENALMQYFFQITYNEKSIINVDVKEEKLKILMVSVCMFILGIFLKLFYYMIHPWPLVRKTKPPSLMTLVKAYEPC